MDAIKKIPTSLPGVFILEPRVFGDERGFFLESYNERVLAELGIVERFVQDNHSCSRAMSCADCTIRSNRRRENWCAWLKVKSLDVAVDLRRSSPTFRRVGSGAPVRREQADAVDSAGICAWIPRDLGQRARSLQID